MAFKPLYDRLLVKRQAEETQTASGLFIPDSAKEKPLRGEVVAAGSGKLADDGTVRAMDVKVGDHVLFGKFAGTELSVDGEDRIILREDDVLGVIID